MAYLLGCESVHLEFPTKKVFDSVTLGINEGDRIGIVGGNGDGKSTLLALLAGSIEPDSGRILRRGGTTIHMLQQTDDLDPETTVGWRSSATSPSTPGRLTRESAASSAGSSPTSPGTAASARSPAASAVASTLRAC